MEPYIAPSVKPDWLLRFQANGILREGEILEFAVGGFIEKTISALIGKQHKGTGFTLEQKALQLDKRRGIVVVTNVRLLFYMPKLLGRYEVDSYYLDRIEAVEFTKGRFKGRVQVTITNDDKVVKGMDNGEGKKLAEYLQKVILDHRPAAGAPAGAQEAQDPINALKMRLASGEITQEEYENLRRVLEA